MSHLLISSVSSSLQITNHSFQYTQPHLWNQLPSSFRQPHSVYCPPGSPHPAHITSSQSPPSLSPSVTPSTFHSRLKTHLFHKSCFPYPPVSQDSLSWSWTRTELTTYQLFCFSFFFIYMLSGYMLQFVKFHRTFTFLQSKLVSRVIMMM